MRRLLQNLTASDPENVSGRVIARECPCCGHHEIGVELKTATTCPLNPEPG
ncbi:MAG: hypothetical protein R2875_00490 [Desulfobacterales bacterium]